MAYILKFDGVNDYLNIDPSINMHGIWGITEYLYDIDMYIYSGGNGQVRLLGNADYRNYILITNTNIQIRYGVVGTASIPLTTPLPTDQLFNLKIKRLGNTHTILVDDVPNGTVESTLKTNAHEYNSRIGFIGVDTVTSEWGLSRFRQYLASDGTGTARVDWNADLSSKTPGTPVVLLNSATTADGVGINMPTSEIAFVDIVSTPLPIADAGVDQFVTKDTVVTLDGSASVDTNATGTLTYLWSQISGDTVTLSSNTAVNPTFTAINHGIYSFQLVVNDGVESSTPDTVSVSAPEIGGLVRYDSIKLGQIITTPASMVGEEGLFFPCIIPTSEIPDANFPAKFNFVCYASPSHSTGAAGIWLFLCSGDPTLSSSWVEYDTAVAAGDFNYLVSKPTGNPIFVDTTYGTQCETPCVNNINGTLFMTYHNSQNVTYANTTQHTCLAKSPDGINYTREYITGNVNGTLLVSNPKYQRGNGHTGYFKWGLNPFSGVPFTYVGYSILGGGTWSHQAMWVSNDAESWSINAFLSNAEGRITSDIPESYETTITSVIDVRNIEPMGDGTYRVITAARQAGVTPSGIKNTRLVEVLLSDDGHTVLTKAQQFLNPTVGDFDEGDVRSAHVFDYNAEKYVIYTGTKDVAGTLDNNLGIAKLTSKAGALVTLDPIRADTTETSFKNLGALPANVVFHNPNTDASYALTANGLEVTVPAGSNAGFYLTNTIDLTTTPICDFFLKGFRWISDEKCRTTIGAYNNPLNTALHPKISASQIGTTNSYFKLYSTDVNGVYTTQDTENYVGWDDDYTTRQSESPQALLDAGIRIIPNYKVYFLNSGKRERVSVGGTFNSSSMQPLVVFTNDDTVSNTVIVDGFEFGNTSHVYTQPAPIGTTTVDSVTPTTTTCAVAYSYNNTDETGYKYRLNGGATVDIGTTNPFTITGLTADTSYTVEVLAYNANGDGAWSSPATTFDTLAITSTLNMTATNTPDGTYSADIYNDDTKVLIETKNITFSSGDASEVIAVDVGTNILVKIDGASPPTTGLAYVGATE